MKTPDLARLDERRQSLDYLSVLDVTQQPSLWQHHELLKYPVRFRYAEVKHHSD